MARDDEIELWSIDEVKFQQSGSRCRMWIPPEVKNPIALQSSSRKSIGYFGAVRISDGKFVYQRETDMFNGETFFNFMKKMKRVTSRSHKKVVLITDNAKYHHALLHREWRKEKEGKKFFLDFLPPYSPELNSIERVWKLTRRSCLHNQYFDSIDAIVESVESKFDEWKYGNETLRKLCAIN